MAAQKKQLPLAGEEKATRKKLTPLLRKLLNAKTIPGLEWYNQEQGLWKLPWKHHRTTTWGDSDALLFRELAKVLYNYKGPEEPSPDDLKCWKERIRNSLGSPNLKDVIEVKDLHCLQGDNTYKVYQFINGDSDIKKSTKVKSSAGVNQVCRSGKNLGRVLPSATPAYPVTSDSVSSEGSNIPNFLLHEGWGRSPEGDMSYSAVPSHNDFYQDDTCDLSSQKSGIDTVMSSSTGTVPGSVGDDFLDALDFHNTECTTLNPGLCNGGATMNNGWHSQYAFSEVLNVSNTSATMKTQGAYFNILGSDTSPTMKTQGEYFNILGSDTSPRVPTSTRDQNGQGYNIFNSLSLNVFASKVTSDQHYGQFKKIYDMKQTMSVTQVNRPSRDTETHREILQLGDDLDVSPFEDTMSPSINASSFRSRSPLSFEEDPDNLRPLSFIPNTNLVMNMSGQGFNDLDGQTLDMSSHHGLTPVNLDALNTCDRNITHSERDREDNVLICSSALLQSLPSSLQQSTKCMNFIRGSEKAKQFPLGIEVKYYDNTVLNFKEWPSRVLICFVRDGIERQNLQYQHSQGGLLQLLELPSPSACSALRTKQGKGIKKILENLAGGVIINFRDGDIYATRYCKAGPRFCIPNFTQWQKLERGVETKIFEFSGGFEQLYTAVSVEPRVRISFAMRCENQGCDPLTVDILHRDAQFLKDLAEENSASLEPECSFSNEFDRILYIERELVESSSTISPSILCG